MEKDYGDDADWNATAAALSKRANGKARQARVPVSPHLMAQQLMARQQAAARRQQQQEWDAVGGALAGHAAGQQRW